MKTVAMIFPLAPIRPRWSISSLCAACAGAMILLSPASAAEPTKKPPAVRQGAKKAEPAPFVPKPIEPLLTREQLRDCMALQARNKDLAAEVTRMQTEVTAQTDEVKRDGEALRADMATVDRSNAEAVNAYNLRAANRSRQVADFEGRVADFNAKVQAFEDGRAGYARTCENRKFDEKDEKALLKGS
ncbi:MAG: hypothetical protein ABI564_01295 [Ideonella sp.]